MKKWIGYDIDRLSPSTTGLNNSVLVVANRYFDMPIIKVLVEGDNGQIFTIEKPVRCVYECSVLFSESGIVQIKQWIEMNRKTLLEYWNGDIDTSEMVGKLQKILIYEHNNP